MKCKLIGFCSFIVMAIFVHMCTYFYTLHVTDLGEQLKQTEATLEKKDE